VATSDKEFEEWCCGLLDGGTRVGNREGVGGGRRVRGAATPAAAAFAAPVLRVVASLGILFGGFTEAPLSAEAVAAAAPPVLLIFAAPAVDLVTRVGR